MNGEQEKTGEVAQASPVVSEPISAAEGSISIEKPSFRERLYTQYVHLKNKVYSSGKRTVAFLGGGALVILVITLHLTGFFSTSREFTELPRQFTKVYSFVPEKLSESAPVPISLPETVVEDVAKGAITFFPEIRGSWVTEDIPNVILFQPNQALEKGKYYAVTLDAPGAQMSGDFFVDEDPSVTAIFPAMGSETHEDSEITIVFNRPMVPLTSLEITEGKPLPITLTPPTEGRFKWISTRNLQFIPETSLRPSSEYRIEVGEGLTSVDGLSVPSFTHSFRTRPLRYEFLSSEVIGYRSPIIIQFNQPVDLEKTRSKIRVRDGDGAPVSLDITYGVRRIYDWETGTYTEEENRAVLFVYQTRDSHRRERYWEFDSYYTLEIDGAETEMGTMPLTETRTTSVKTPNIVESITAASDRTDLVRPDFLDPEGTLTVTFYDEIDIDKLEVKVKGFRAMELGERCKTDARGEEMWGGDGCIKEKDPRTVIFSFDPGAFQKNEEFELTLTKVIAKEGFRISEEPYGIKLRTYPQFVVSKIVPEEGSTNAAVDGATVCSTAPLQGLGEDETLKKFVTASGYIVYGTWYGSRYIDPYDTWYQGPCAQGEFESDIRYGLLPQTAYTLTFTLTDAFGQTANAERRVTTEPPREEYTRLHNLQQVYNVTKPGRTKLTYAAENLEVMNLHICKMTPETFLARTNNRQSDIEPPTDTECTQVMRDTISLPRRYWVNNYFQVDLSTYFPDSRGQYVVTLSSPLYTTVGPMNTKRQLYDRTYVNVTNLAVGKKEVERVDTGDDEYAGWQRSSSPGASVVKDRILQGASNLYVVMDSTTLAPISGVTVTQYARIGNEYGASSIASRKNGVTDSTGVARISTESKITGAVIRSGADTTIVSDWSDTLGYAGRPESASRTYIYTDRPIYRPGQTVYVRGIDRIGYDGSYEVWSKDPVTFTAEDAGGKTIHTTMLPVSQYGTFSTSFDIPQDAPLGLYRMSALGQEAYISVEEYVPAPFKIDVRAGKDEYMNGDTSEVAIQADYYFGVPLDGGTVSYGITAQDYYFDRYTDEYFTFGRDWYSCYSCGYGDSFIARGEVPLNPSGHAVIREPLTLDTLFEGDDRGGKLVTVSISVKDRNGRSVSSSQSFIVHYADIYLGVKTEPYFGDTKSPVTLRAKTVNVTGQGEAVDDVALVINKISWDIFKRQEVDGGFYYRSEETRTEVKRFTFDTDRNGDWSGTYQFGEGGEYEIITTGKDTSGRTVTAKTRIYILGNEAVFTPPNNNYELDIELERSSLKVGENASLLIKSPYERAKVLITAERGVIHDHWVVDVVGGLYKHTFTVPESYTPNMTISALLFSPEPEVKYGSTYLGVESDAHRLQVTATPNKNAYLPGEEVVLRVLTTDVGGRPVPAEVSVAVADLSVLALRGNPKKDPYQFFYDGFPLAVSTASNIKNILYEAEIPLGTKGGGGADPDDLAKKKRGIFKDTAYWTATLVTGGDGVGEARFTLPDNLTTWQVEVLGVTEDTRLGVGYREFTTKKELMVVPQKPRFIVPGDTFSLGAHIFNQSDDDETVTVKLESPTLTFLEEKERQVHVKKGESEIVYMDVEAPKAMKEGVHTFTFTGTTDEGQDIVELEIPITKNTVYETVATADFTRATTTTEYLFVPNNVEVDEGELTINANATLAVFMSDALTYMAQYPYGCSEQIASALSTIAMVTRAQNVSGIEGEMPKIKDMYGVEHTVDDVVVKGLARIYETEVPGGGFTYYKGMQPNLHLTIRVALALNELKNAGYEIRHDVLTRAVSFIESGAATEYRKYPESAQYTVILADYVVHTVGVRTSTVLDPIVSTFIKDKAYVNERIGSAALGYLALLTTEGFSESEKKRVYEALTNRIDIDGRGAYLKNPREGAYGYFETSVGNTALLLRAFVAHNDEHPTIGNVLRWLLAARDRDGVWGSTQNTFMVVSALIEYLAWQNEAEAEFTLKSMLGEQELFTYAFGQKNGTGNIYDTFTHIAPMSTLPRNALTPLTFTRTDEPGAPRTNLYYDMSLRYYLPAEAIPSRDEGITISRELFALTDTNEKNPLRSAEVGDVLKGKITLTIPESYSQVAVEDIIPAGFEIVNFNLATEDRTLLEGEGESGDSYAPYDEYGDGWGMGMNTEYTPPAPGTTSLFGTLATRIRSFFNDEPQVAQLPSYYDEYDSYDASYERAYTRTLYSNHTESHDDRVFLYVEELDPGVYEYEYYLRALIPGEFVHMPAQASELYFPEVFGRTSGNKFTVTQTE